MSSIRNRIPLELLGKLFAFGVLVFYTCLSLLPMYLMVVSSLVPIGSDFDVTKLQLIPRDPSLENLFKFNERVDGELPRYILNSLLVSTLPVITSVFFGTLAGFALSKMRFPGREFLFWTIITTMAIPYFVILIPLYEMIWIFHWMDTYAALIVPTMAGIASVFLARQFLQTLPLSLLEAAAIDGCGEFKIFCVIVLPMMRPLLAVLSIMGFVAAWSDYFWAYLVVTSRLMYTIQMGIIGVMGVDAGWAGDLDFGEIMAASVVASIPVIVVFLTAQKHFVRGLTIGAVKG